jgi:hypothetical protein
VPPNAFKTAPLVVLNNFSPQQKQLALAANLFQGMFPSINVHTVNLSTCQVGGLCWGGGVLLRVTAGLQFSRQPSSAERTTNTLRRAGLGLPQKSNSQTLLMGGCRLQGTCCSMVHAISLKSER